MNRIAISSVIALSISAISGAAAAKNEWLSKPGRFYVGADVMMRHMGYEKNRGQDLIARDSTAHNFYGGMNLNDYFALEIGHTVGHNKESQLTSGERVLEATLGKGCTEMHHILKAKFTSWHFNIAGFSKYYKDKIRLVGSIGLSRARVDFQHRIPWCLNAMGNTVPQFTKQRLLNNRKYTTIPKASVGIQAKITKRISVKLASTWEATSKLGKFIDEYNGDTKDYIAKPRNSVSYSVGFVLSL